MSFGGVIIDPPPPPPPPTDADAEHGEHGDAHAVHAQVAHVVLQRALREHQRLLERTRLLEVLLKGHARLLPLRRNLRLHLHVQLRAVEGRLEQPQVGRRSVVEVRIDHVQEVVRRAAGGRARKTRIRVELFGAHDGPHVQRVPHAQQRELIEHHEHFERRLVNDGEHGALLGHTQRPHRLHHVVGGGGVQSGGGLVQKKQLGGDDQLAADGDAPPLPAGDASNQPVADGGVAHLGEAQVGQHFFGDGAVLRVGAGHAQAGGVEHRLEDGHRAHQHLVLGDVGATAVGELSDVAVHLDGAGHGGGGGEAARERV